MNTQLAWKAKLEGALFLCVHNCKKNSVLGILRKECRKKMGSLDVLMQLQNSFGFGMVYIRQYDLTFFYRPKVNNQPLKKLLCFAFSLVKVVKNGKILTFKVNFVSKKLSESF